MAQALEGKVAAVTGGASGIGLSVVRRFLHEGACVVLADVNEQNATAALAGISSLGHSDRVRFVRADVSDEPQVETVVGAAVEEFGRLDVMFNNAGIGGAFGAITDLELEDWNYSFSILVGGVFLGTKHAARQMIAQGAGGSIINTGSVAGMLGGAGPLCYSAAKGAVLQLTRAASLELARHRIRVNAVVPGVIDTPLMNGGKRGLVEPTMSDFVPWPHLGEPEHVAGAVTFLAGDDSSFITGESIVVDGGMVAGSPGVVMRAGFGSGAPGVSGVNVGTTGKPNIVRRPGIA